MELAIAGFCDWPIEKARSCMTWQDNTDADISRSAASRHRMQRI
jgi:hypothetical protein